MQNLLKGAIVLSMFAIALTLLQISCSKSNAQQNRPSEEPQLNKIAYIKIEGAIIGSSYVTTSTIWISNYDGTGKVMIPISPNGITADQFTSCSLSPDGQTVFFTTASQSGYSLHSCKIDGTNLTQIETPSGNDVHYVVGTAQ